MRVYLCGGAVRDTYMKKQVSDQDFVVVGATPEDLLREGFQQVGASFPVFLHPVTREEYALARTERKTGPGYHGFETVYDESVTLEDDLARRDFTINAMAIDMDTADLIDPHGGFKDLKAKTLRHVGPAFREDPLRVVRMARFLARFTDFTAADETFFLAQEMVRNGELNELSWERFAAEIHKVLDTCTPDGCFTFFDVLDKLRCSEHVSFFAGMNLQKAARAAKHVKLKIAPVVRAEIFAALAFDETERCEHVGGVMGRDVRRLLDLLVLDRPDAEMMYNVLHKSGAWKNSHIWPILVASVQLGQELGRYYAFHWTQLVQAEAVTTPYGRMGAELAAQGVKGADIGRRIKEARMGELLMLDL